MVEKVQSGKVCLLLEQAVKQFILNVIDSIARELKWFN